MAFSRDGKILASGSSDRTVRLRNVATGRAVVTPQADDFVFSLAFSPDGKMPARSVNADPSVKL